MKGVRPAVAKTRLASQVGGVAVRTAADSRRLRGLCGRALRRALLRISLDPAVEHRVAGRSLLVPLSHDLPKFIARFPLYNVHQRVVARSVFGKYPRLTAVDIGANVGDTVAYWRSAGDFPILAVEGDPVFAGFLTLNTHGDASIEHACTYLSDEEGSRMMATYRGGGTARIELQDDGAPAIAMQTLPSLLDRHGRFAHAKLVKIDTDGHDIAILNGALPWLASSRPVIVFEYFPALVPAGPSAARGIFDALASVGYRTLLFFENTGPYLISLATTDAAQLDDLHEAVAAGGTRPYWDICALHEEDAELGGQIRAAMLLEQVHLAPRRT